MPIRLIVGYWIGGITPKRLLTRISTNIENSRGTKRRKSLLPMMSRATPLRTNPYRPSVTHCVLLGTIAARLVVAINHQEISPTESNRTTAGRVMARGPSNHSG